MKYNCHNLGWWMDWLDALSVSTQGTVSEVNWRNSAARHSGSTTMLQVLLGITANLS